MSKSSCREASQLDDTFKSADALVSNVAVGGACEVYVGRRTRTHAGSPWGNPHVLVGNSARSRLECVRAYANDLMEGRFGSSVSITAALQGRILGCWCAPSLCHAHSLAVLANLGEKQLELFIDVLGNAHRGEPRRLLVTGSRTWTDREAIAAALYTAWDGWGRPADAVLIAGGAGGADRIAAECWEKAGLRVETHLPDWESHGQRAGMIRNAAMVASGADACLAFQVGDSKGTAQAMRAAAKAGIPVTHHHIK